MRANFLPIVTFFIFAFFISAGLSVALTTESSIAGVMINEPESAYIIFAALFIFILGMALTLVSIGKQKKDRNYVKQIRSIVLD